MRFKRIICLTMAVLSVFLFASCSGDTSGGADLSSFQSVDVENNAVDQSVFKDDKLTMINIWGTFCGPCINEMPDLGELSQEYSGKGVQIIGIPIDVMDYSGAISEDVLATAKEIIDKTGADYMHILPSESLYNAKLYQVSSIPETIFVDKDGKQVGESYIGSRTKEQWKEIIDGLLVDVE